MINLLSQLPLLQATPAVSTDSSAPVEQDFSALLTELVGSAAEPEEGQESLPVGESPETLDPDLRLEGVTDSTAFLVSPGLALGTEPVPAPQAGSRLPAVPPLHEDASLAAALIAGIHFRRFAADPLADPDPTSDPVPDSVFDAAMDSEIRPENSDANPEAILADVKKFEVAVRHEIVEPAEVEPLQELRPALVTTDPIESVRQPQLPPRVIAIQKVSAKTGSSDQENKAAAAIEHKDVPTSATGFQLIDPARSFDAIEQPLAAQYIEIPDVPKLQVVRTVSMEVGDAESQVIVRIEDRGGNMNLHFGTGSETMHRNLEASVISLLHSLRKEKIEVSNVEVYRKSPIEKVRRMKESH